LVRRHFHKYLTGHVPSSVRAAAGRKGRLEASYRMRARRFRTVIAEVVGDRTRISREDLLEVCNRVHRQSFASGWTAHKYSIEITKETAA
jgi:hypothetical protein